MALFSSYIMYVREIAYVASITLLLHAISLMNHKHDLKQSWINAANIDLNQIWHCEQFSIIFYSSVLILKQRSSCATVTTTIQLPLNSILLPTRLQYDCAAIVRRQRRKTHTFSSRQWDCRESNTVKSIHVIPRKVI